MVVGNGLIARSFSEYQDNEQYLFFCSGVSNSTCKDPAQFEREKNLLVQNINSNKEKVLIYFSTCSIADPSMSGSMYVRHKLDTEAYIREHCPRFHIFRLSNVVGNTSNRITVFNFLFDAIESGTHFKLWTNSNRNLIDTEDAASIVRQVLEKNSFQNSTINVANTQSYDVLYIVREMETFLGKNGNYELVDKGIRFQIPIPETEAIIEELGIDFGENYLHRLLEKYYSR